MMLIGLLGYSCATAVLVARMKKSALPIQHVRLREHLHGITMQQLDDRGRGSGWRHQAEPRHRLEPAVAGFGHRRQLGRHGRASGGGDRKGAELPLAH
jgi:hypothetical protein